MDDPGRFFFRGLVFALAFQLAACAVAAGLVWLVLQLLGRV